MRLSDTQRFGTLIENWACDQLAKRGWHVRLMPDFFESFDILLDGFLPVEVKGAKPYEQWTGKRFRTRWQWDLKRGLNPATQDFLYILVSVDQAGELFPFLVPSAWTVGRGKTPALTSHPTRYGGWLADGLNAWSHVAMVYSWRQKFLCEQPTLFDFAEVVQ